MRTVVITDASVLIILSKIEELGLLRSVYGEILTTKIIADEFGEPLPEWIKIREVADEKYFDYISTRVDKGEASAIALATQYENPLLLMDDRKAKKLAMQLKMKVTGVIGFLIYAKKVGKLVAIKPVIDKILVTNFRIDQKIIDFALAECNEE